MKTHTDQHLKVLEKIATIEARTDRKKLPRITIEQAEAMQQKKAEISKQRKLKAKHRPRFKSNGLSWLTGFQRAIWLALTDVQKHQLPRTWFRRRIKIPKEVL